VFHKRGYGLASISQKKGVVMKTAFSAALLSLLIALPALAFEQHYHGAPGPLVGAGLPVLALGGGIYWIVKRVRRKKLDRPARPEPSTE
jgi:hypothetical protein